MINNDPNEGVRDQQPGKLKIQIQLSRYDFTELESIAVHTVVVNNSSNLESSQSKPLKSQERTGSLITPQVVSLPAKPRDRDDLIASHNLPNDAIIKLKYNGKLIPWSLVPLCNCQAELLDIQVFRPHQNIKPKLSESFPSDSLIREKVNRLESRISSLENSVDPVNMDIKTEQDLQLLTKQISFLRKRLEEADQAEWIKKSF